MKDRIIIFTGALSKKEGSRTDRVFQRVKLFEDMGYECVVATQEHRVEHKKRFDMWTEKYGIKSACYENIFDHYGMTGSGNASPEQKPGLTSMSGKKLCKQFKTGNGTVCREFYFDGRNEEPVKRVFLDDNQEMYLSIPAEEEIMIPVRLAGEDGEIRYFKSFSYLFCDYIDYLDERYEKPIYVFENQDCITYVIRMMRDKLRNRVMTIVHGDLIDADGQMRMLAQRVFDDNEVFTHVLVKDQKNLEIVRHRYGTLQNLGIIPEGADPWRKVLAEAGKADAPAYDNVAVITEVKPVCDEKSGERLKEPVFDITLDRPCEDFDVELIAGEDYCTSKVMKAFSRDKKSDTEYRISFADDNETEGGGQISPKIVLKFHLHTGAMNTYYYCTGHSTLIDDEEDEDE